jgi:hypothetical protein
MDAWSHATMLVADEPTEEGGFHGESTTTPQGTHMVVDVPWQDMLGISFLLPTVTFIDVVGISIARGERPLTLLREIGQLLRWAWKH